jgi:bacterioferritin
LILTRVGRCSFLQQIEIVGMDVKQLLNVLNTAFADEWLAYYQYWLGAKVVTGPMAQRSP